MDIGFDWTEWRLAPDAGLPGAVWGNTPDWHVLRSRLGSAWLARQAFAELADGPARPQGSFAPSAAQALGALGSPMRETFCAVNRTALGNCKTAAAIVVMDAGNLLAGDRGLV